MFLKAHIGPSLAFSNVIFKSSPASELKYPSARSLITRNAVNVVRILTPSATKIQAALDTASIAKMTKNLEKANKMADF